MKGGGEVRRGGGVKEQEANLLLEAAGGLYRDLQMQDLKGCIGFGLAQRPCCQSRSPVCVAHGTCSKAHSQINSSKVGDVLNTR